jgi:hypothetical protein
MQTVHLECRMRLRPLLPTAIYSTGVECGDDVEWWSEAVCQPKALTVEAERCQRSYAPMAAMRLPLPIQLKMLLHLIPRALGTKIPATTIPRGWKEDSDIPAVMQLSIIVGQLPRALISPLLNVALQQ